MHTTSERIRLTGGVHAIAVDYEQDGGGRSLNVQWAPAGGTPAPFAPMDLFPTAPEPDQLRPVARVHWWRATLPFIWFGPLLALALLVGGPRISRAARRALEQEASGVPLSDTNGWRVPGLVWIDRHPAWCLLGFVVLAAGLRVLLAAGAPAAFGYVYDPYHEPVERLYLTGALPESPECWQCYHPPLFYVSALPFYATGMWISGWDPQVALRVLAFLATLCGAVTAYYGYRVLVLFRFRGIGLVLGTALILVTPVLFVSSYGAEADIVLTAIMAAFLYHLTRYHLAPETAPFTLVLGLGILAGLAMATKYSGLIAVVVAGELLAVHLVVGRHRRRTIRDGLVVLTICLALGSWKYVDNRIKYDTFLFANGSAQEGFQPGTRERYGERYDFTTFELRELIALTYPDAPDGGITYLPVYRSVWTTLYGQLWGDMSFFTNPTRGGIDNVYLWRGIPPWLTSSVLVLGLLPTLLGGIGVLSTLRRTGTLPVALTSVTTLAVYVYWFTAQEHWALKTKYLLFLLPAYAVYALFGLDWLRQRSSVAHACAVWLLALLVVLGHAYLFRFAVGAV